MEVLDMSYDLVYDNLNRKEKLSTTQVLPGGTLKSDHFFTYENGKIVESSGNELWRYVYTYDGDQIIRTDEFIDTHLTQHYTFSYDDRDRLIESITWQDIPEEGGLIPVYKETFQYNSQNNVTEHRLYYFDSGTKTHRILTSFFFSDYDDKVNTEEYFIGYGFNPNVRFKVNNPGKMVVINRHNVITSTDLYTYTYEGNFAEKKQTHSTLVNGNIVEYETRYFLESR